MKWNQERQFSVMLSILLTCLFTSLKISGLIKWSWLWVLSPCWIFGYVIIFLFLFKLIVLR